MADGLGLPRADVGKDDCDRDTIEGKFWDVHDGQGDEVLGGMWRPGWRHHHHDGPVGGDRVLLEKHRDGERQRGWLPHDSRASSRQPCDQWHRGAGRSDRGGSNQGHEDRA